jgi:hypothetical protein
LVRNRIKAFGVIVGSAFGEGPLAMPTPEPSPGSVADTLECAARSRRLLLDMRTSIEETHRMAQATVSVINETWALIRLIDDRGF